MCGIGVILNLDSKPVGALTPSLELMNRLLAHRGPDGEGTWVHDRRHAGFAHRRLEIIDLETGQQPMHDGNGNWITYNGEIYNYVELREELRGLGHRFTTASDTEPIPLTAAGRRLLRRGGRVTLTALLRAKDLAGNTAASQARAKLS